MVRYNTNGSIDNTFGTNGIVITPIGSLDVISQLQPLYKLMGKIVWKVIQTMVVMMILR